MLLSTTLPTSTPRLSFWGKPSFGILWRKLMISKAVCLGAFLFSVGFPPYSKTGKVSVLVFGKYLSWWPSKLKSTIDCVVVKPRFFRPLHDGLVFSFVGYSHITSAIIGLLFSGGPLTIFRAIVRVIVYTFKGVTLGTRAHISLESCKFVPAPADNNSTSSVVGILDIIRIIAATPHRPPNDVNRSSAFAVSFVHPGNVLYWEGKVK